MQPVEDVLQFVAARPGEDVGSESIVEEDVPGCGGSVEQVGIVPDCSVDVVGFEVEQEGHVGHAERVPEQGIRSKDIDGVPCYSWPFRDRPFEDRFDAEREA